ncbi:helix-turn-helix domain-containing protein [Cylindrospermum sp. FACHB-282]|uniref:helix-turn-helix domain-containing protein n=1 Tax=Cylindrospermum sp. FACHB-282 TaxID=2692794 RepID=UPI00168541D1|nr:AraC family transcriptional regulator [Cylindrospermum sp. FACHB-282]MBD2387104.1 helix-turn-helix domain-containing protein [Cylindrospermum sp. FACHB-282]
MVSSTCIAEQSNPQVTLKLQQEELRFTKFLMDRVTDPIFWIEPDEKLNPQLLYVNQAACRLVDYRHEQLMYMGIQNLNLDFLINVWSSFCNTIEKQRYLSFETLHHTKEGHSLPLHVTVTSVECEGKKYSYLFICHLKYQQIPLILPRNEIQQPTQEKELETLCNQQSTYMSVAETVKKEYSLSFTNQSLLNKVFEFIGVNYQQPISLSDVAKGIGYCPSYLTNLVRRHTGKTINNWICEYRMVTARKLLRETNLSISQIANAVGFQNESHFFRQFREQHQTTPQAWRNAQNQICVS